MAATQDDLTPWGKRGLRLADLPDPKWMGVLRALVAKADEAVTIAETLTGERDELLRLWDKEQRKVRQMEAERDQQAKVADENFSTGRSFFESWRTEMEKRRATEGRLEEIRVLAHKTLYGPDPEPSIQAMQKVLRLAE